MKYIISTSILFLFAQICFAETCPSVSDIKKNAIAGWKAYDSDDGKPLSTTREIKFKKMLQHFALAEWKMGKNLVNSMHCYYRDKTGSSLEAYLAKDHFIPVTALKNHPNYWYQVSGYMHCAAGKERCEFETRDLMKNQLAKRQGKGPKIFMLQ